MMAQSTTARATRIGTALLLLALGATIACTRFTIRAERDPGADFARYRTFAWLPIAMSPPADQDTGDRGINRRIYTAVETELQRKRYAPGASAASDLLVTFRLLRKDGFDEAQLPYAAQWHRGAYQEAPHATDDTYVRGTLIVDVIDRTTNALVWRGSASARLTPKSSYDATAERAESAVEQILASFPAR